MALRTTIARAVIKGARGSNLVILR